MTRVFLSTLTLPTAPMKGDNPLPPLRPLRDIHAGIDAGAADADMAANLSYGHVTSLLPYTNQDGYGRDLADVTHRTVVLENEHLRAEFLPGLGGRLWSLVHLPTGRELLHRNPVLQLANLGLRNAWFAGGVEWNIGTIGHTPLGCGPVHAARTLRPDGTPALRMWEFERLRELVYQIDAYLPPASPVLYVHVRVSNPGPDDAPMYWWSNIAVPQTPDTRVIAPATEAYHLSYNSVLRRVPIPGDDQDETYPARAPIAADFFFDIPAGRRRFIAALQADGAGLVQTSTERLAGRKLFRWGNGLGGRNWQSWLSGPSAEYLEIQAGLARTQLEHLRLPAGESWTWLEAYGLLAADPTAVHGSDWQASRDSVADALDQLVPPAVMEAELRAAGSWSQQPPVAPLHQGTGWGALQRRLHAHLGDPAPHLPATPFDDHTLGRDQQSWLALLETGAMPAPAPSLPPSSYAVGDDWRELLQKSTAQHGDHWFTWLHLGVALYHRGDIDRARDAWQRSNGLAENAWATRNLAVLDELAGDPAAAAQRLLTAHRMAPRLRQLTVETLQTLLRADRPTDALTLVDRVDPEQRMHGRVRLLECQAALNAGDLARAGSLLDRGIIVEDLREGENTLSALWWTYHQQRSAAAGLADVRRDHPLPCRYDYRMHDSQ
ncbi:DUF5107 domain-containing protein [Dactylosporangium sp. NPDC049525]|uniref:DUF5107 domain-containing protein n=1 Tax=Dactylosporangium sp. NPDC049525 TaxID=3154730 RepID=UPI00341910D7